MSNLLEKASILTTPTAYNDGKLLSVKPTNVLGNELVTNGDFATDSDWSKDNSWSISGGKANYLYVSNRNMNSQSATLVVGRTYKLVYTILDYVSGNVQNNSASSQTSNSSNGTYTEYFVARFSFLRFRGSTNGNLSIDNVSVKEVTDGDFDFTRGSTATRVNSSGLIESVASGLPRIDYTDGVGSILLQPQSTNLVIDSQDYSSRWTGQGVTTSDGGAGLFYLSQTSNVIKSETIQVGFNQSYYNLPTAVTIGNTYTQQCYIKSNDCPYMHFQVSPISSGSLIVWDNINKVVISSDPSIDSFNITSLEDGWIKVEITYTAVVSSIYGALKVYFSTNPANRFVGVPIGTIIYFTFAQLEQKSFATSYIPTNGSTVTRNTETLNNAGSSDLINSTEGVLYAEIAALSDDLTFREISISSGNSSNSIAIKYRNTSNVINFTIVSGGSSVFNISETVPNIRDFNKVALKYKSGDISIWINGVEKTTSTSSFTITGLSEISFDNGSGYSDFYGKTKCLAVFKEALTDDELTCLTTT